MASLFASKPPPVVAAAYPPPPLPAPTEPELPRYKRMPTPTSPEILAAAQKTRAAALARHGFLSTIMTDHAGDFLGAGRKTADSVLAGSGLPAVGSSGFKLGA